MTGAALVQTSLLKAMSMSVLRNNGVRFGVRHEALAASAWSNALLSPRIAPGAYERRPDAGDGQDNPFNLSTKKTAQFALYAIVGHEQAQMEGSKNP
ncbi:hypothetical protein GCM10007872_00560 [Gluconobacter sphaericus NBRC 12467]|uniref:Uncharacterized protein n=1 Tax=Gluconobacter sphaericus NBRC 12467 TaxID=1307951 RepID=A0AA37SEN4_9PROT|nr:hypothetical protein GCM10007872_00560 [Gluconobacter sphaericus NBRC 12467]